MKLRAVPHVQPETAAIEPLFQNVWPRIGILRYEILRTLYVPHISYDGSAVAVLSVDK